jgi:hypothetical protein
MPRLPCPGVWHGRVRTATHIDGEMRIANFNALPNGAKQALLNFLRSQ